MDGTSDTQSEIGGTDESKDQNAESDYKARTSNRYSMSNLYLIHLTPEPESILIKNLIFPLYLIKFFQPLLKVKREPLLSVKNRENTISMSAKVSKNNK